MFMAVGRISEISHLLYDWVALTRACLMFTDVSVLDHLPGKPQRNCILGNGAVTSPWD